jgi:orotate phosphoribosyltransferase-like protein
VIPERIEFPETIVDGITQHPNRLIGCASFVSEHSANAIPIKATNVIVGIDQSVVPVGEIVAQCVEIQPRPYQHEEAQGINV